MSARAVSHGFDLPPNHKHKKALPKRTATTFTRFSQRYTAQSPDYQPNKTIVPLWRCAKPPVMHRKYFETYKFLNNMNLFLKSTTLFLLLAATILSCGKVEDADNVIKDPEGILVELTWSNDAANPAIGTDLELFVRQNFNLFKISNI